MKNWLLLACGLMFAEHACALELPSIFADKMVLQQKQPVPVWGTAKAGANVSVKFANQEISVLAGKDGKWHLDLNPMSASSQSRVFEVTSDGKTIEYTDVLVGEVWFAGGQSNMYRPFRMLTHPANDPFYEPITDYLRNERDTANDPLFRQYRAGQIYNPYEAETIGRGSWSQAISGEVNEFCATAYFFGRELRRELDVPVALISCNKGGTIIEAWIAPKAYESTETLTAFYEEKMAKLKDQLATWDQETELAKYKEAVTKREKAIAEGEKVSKKSPRKPEAPQRNRSIPGTLYNGMVHPIAPYGMRGVIWYQGESNSGNDPKEYGNRMAALIEGWRSVWGQKRLPFYWCQLANYKAVTEEPLGDDVDGYIWVQNAQREALKIADTGMAVLNDIGEARDVHPKNKVDAGKRLSRWALNKVYERDLVPSGPLYKEAALVRNRVRITFDHVGSGLTAATKHLLDPTVLTNDPLKYFQIRENDSTWKWAQARIITPSKVDVWHPEVLRPTEVRYAWATNPKGANLYNKEGLPASLFKTGKLKRLPSAWKEGNYDESIPTPTHANVSYGKHSRNILDFWQAPSEQPTPLVFVIHGGGWKGGRKERLDAAVDTTALLEAGISVAAINYRLMRHSAELKPPVTGPLNDATRALQFLRHHAEKYNIDKTRIAASGTSAGACTSLWLAYHDDLADSDNKDPILRESTRLHCVAQLRGQTTLDPKQMKEWIPNSKYGAHAFALESFEDFLAKRETILTWINEYSPYSLLTKDDPPTYSYYPIVPVDGLPEKDPTHSANFGVGLHKRCQELGVPSQLYYPGTVNAPHQTATAYLISQLQN